MTSDSKQMAASRRRKQVAATVGAAVLTIGVAQNVKAQDISNLQHFIDCVGWLISDPETHAANCLPSNIAVSGNSLSGPVTATVPGTSTGPSGPTGSSGTTGATGVTGSSG